MDVGTGSDVGYHSPGRSYPRDRLRSNEWPVRGTGWKQVLFPPVPNVSIPVVVLDGFWYDNTYLTGEWGTGMTTAPQEVNDQNNPILVSGNYAIRLASADGGQPSSSLVAYFGKRGIDNPILSKTPTVSGTSIIVTLLANDLLAFVNSYGYGRMYIEVWDLTHPDPIAIVEVWVAASMRQPI